MATIADSEAAAFARVLPQHQAALTLVQARLSTPNLIEYRWLDLACGRGQIIRYLDKDLSAAAREKIEYYGFDADNEFSRLASQVADSMGLRKSHLDLGDISKFDRIVDEDLRFDFISLTNTVHEVSPANLATILRDCILRLKATGTLFVYDMEQLNPHELGAVPWQRDDIATVVFKLLDELGASDYRPEIGQWKHSSCNGWNLQIDRQHIPMSDDVLKGANSDIAKVVSLTVLDVLRERRRSCAATLEVITKYGAETAEEEATKLRMLYDFWALSRALEI